MITFFFIFAASSLIGCSEPNPTADQVDAGLSSKAWDGMPEDLLKAIFTRYRNAPSYHDAGQVRLTYHAEGEFRSETAPLRVWLDRNTLDVAAYDVRLRQSDRELTACIVEPTTSHFDSQVLKAESPDGRPQLDTILSDSLLAARLQAGLAGPPPQLEWLLADKPMERLFDDSHQFTFAADATVEDCPCRVVEVDAQGDRYRLWIDVREGIIRRVELPVSSLPGSSLPVTSLPVSSLPGPITPFPSMKLTLELTGATFRSPQQPLDPLPLPTRPRYVRRFVPLPPPEPSRVLGSEPSSYRLTDRGGNVILDAKQHDEHIRILGRFAGGETSLGSLLLLQSWCNRLPADVRSQAIFVVVVDRSALNQVPSSLELPLAIDHDQTAERLLALEPGGMTILDQRGRIAWNQPFITPQSLVNAGAMIGDLISEVDVPERLRQQWQTDVHAYQDAIAEAAVNGP